MYVKQYKIVKTVASVTNYLAGAMYTIFVVLFVLSFFKNFATLISSSDLIGAIENFVNSCVLSNISFLLAGIGLSLIARILGDEASSLRARLINEIYGELALYGRVRLDHLKSYGFKDLTEIMNFIKEVEKDMKVSISVNPDAGEAYIS